jgi:hypothetical protein
MCWRRSGCEPLEWDVSIEATTAAARFETTVARLCSAAQPHRSSRRTPTYLAGGMHVNPTYTRKDQLRYRHDKAFFTHSESDSFARRMPTAVSTLFGAACGHICTRKLSRNCAREDPPTPALSRPLSLVSHLHSCYHPGRA